MVSPIHSDNDQLLTGHNIDCPIVMQPYMDTRQSNVHNDNSIMHSKCSSSHCIHHWYLQPDTTLYTSATLNYHKLIQQLAKLPKNLLSLLTQPRRYLSLISGMLPY